MGNISSGHFKPTNNIQEEHNDRTLSPSYLLPEEFRGQNEVNLTSAQARQLKERIIENAKKNYLITFKQKFQAKSYLWSLVINIKTNTTMSDLKKLAEHFDLKYGFQCYQIAIHRDEGYIDENNQPHTNHHAHMEFVTLGKENGKNMMGRISPVKLRQIQTEIAQILGMERGVDKRISGTERIEPRKYAQMKEKERKALNSLKQEKTTLESIIQEKDKEIATLNTLNAKLEKTNKDLQRPSLWDILNEKYIDSTKNKREIETKDKEIDTLKQEKTELESIIQAKDKEIATALDTVNEPFFFTEKTIQEAVKRSNIVIEQFFLLKNIYDNPTDENAEKKAEEYKHFEVFTKLWNAIKLLYSIIEKLFGDKNAKKDHQEILNAITELQEKATETQKAQDQIKTLESNENTLKNDLNAKESVIQTKEKTINELKKQIQEQEYKYTQERERMKAENKRLQEQGQEQGLDKRYTQKDYEKLKKQHADEIEALKKKIQEQNKYRIQANALRYRQAQQKKTMKTKKTTTPTPTPQPTYTPTKRM